MYDLGGGGGKEKPEINHLTVLEKEEARRWSSIKLILSFVPFS